MKKTITSVQDKDQYFKMISHRIDYKGERYFRMNYSSESVIQVCRTTGEIKKGKSNTFGVYIIHKITFLQNYLCYGYVVPCTKREYQKQFDDVVKMLNY